MSVTMPRVQGSPRLEWRCAPLPTSMSRQGKLRAPQLLVPLRSLPVHLRPRFFHAVSLSALPVSSWVFSALACKDTSPVLPPQPLSPGGR